MLTLYYSPGACSLAVHVLLEELGVPFKAVATPISDGATSSPAFLAINPAGRVPALAVDQAVLTEAPAILAHLAARFPEGGATPRPDHVDHGRCIEWLAFLSSSLHIAYAQLWRPRRFVPEGFAAEADFTAHARTLIVEFNQRIEERIGDEWVLASGFSIADCHLLPFYRWGLRIGLPMAQDCPRWTAWSRRMLARPAVARAIQTEGLADDWV